MKNLSYFIIISLLFTSCAFNETVYETGTFSFSYPKDWKFAHTSQNETFGNLEALIYKEDETGNIKTNCNVTSMMLAPQTTLEMLINLGVDEVQGYTGYTKEKLADFTVAGEKTKINSFWAQGSDGQKQYFYQTYVMQNDTGYILTCLMPETADNEAKTQARNFMKSFRFIETTTAQ